MPTKRLDFTVSSQGARINSTDRVFNLPETAIPDDIKFIGNLAHRNLIRSSQIGIVCGEELAAYYGYTGGDVLSIEEVLKNVVNPGDADDSKNNDIVNLFKMDPSPDERDKKPEKRRFKTPLWYYVIREGEIHSEKFPNKIPGSDKNRNQLGKAGSRLVAEVLAGALYYGNDFKFDNSWTSVLHKPADIKPQMFGSGSGAVTIADSFTLREMIEFVKKTKSKEPGCK